ncbi:hypothetical protein LXL04_025819 [Taraxacum kok-saghyz]
MEDLPDEFVVDILSRLPVKTIIHCKCICKKWLDLISYSYFKNLHFSRSPPTLLIHHNSVRNDSDNQPGILTWVEVEDDPDHHHLHHDPLMNLNLNLSPIFQESSTLLVGSVDGMVYLRQDCKDKSFICNPITREYMILPPPRKQEFRPDTTIMTSCFGVGSITNKYKVIRICQLLTPAHLLEAEVYTIGTGGQWRSLSLGNVPYWLGGGYDGTFLGGGYDGTFLNGHAHWPIHFEDSPEKFMSSGFTFWVMKEYGIKESWHKELVISHRIGRNLGGLMIQLIDPIEHLRDGTILMVRGEKLYAYSCEGRTIADTDYGFDQCFTIMAYRPSFLNLRNFESERVYVL